MANTDPLAISTLTVDDAPDGLVLSTEAHWNQNEADWRFFLSKGIVFGMRDERRLVATAALLPYSARNAWISMVLVTECWRRRGLATRLMDACLNAAGERGLTTWLDATPAGAAVYGPLGFHPTLQLRRLRLAKTPPAKSDAALVSCDFDTFRTHDTETIGFQRADLLRELGGRYGSRLVSNGGANALIRDGRAARHIGPLFADSIDRALALVHDIAASETGPLLIDVIAGRGDFLAGLTDAGWNIERPFQRMRFGQSTTTPNEPPFAAAGPEYG
jgi:GNAT superfamily N-acetyltransferase